MPPIWLYSYRPLAYDAAGQHTHLFAQVLLLFALLHVVRVDGSEVTLFEVLDDVALAQHLLEVVPKVFVEFRLLHVL